MPLLSMRGYAKHRGVSPEAVSKAVRDGRISTVSKSGKRLIDPAVADVEWDENSDSSKKSTKTKRERSQQDGPRPETKASYANARAARETYLAKLAKLEFDKKSGTLVSIDEVKVGWFKVINSAKTKIMGIHSKCKAQYPDLPIEVVNIIEQVCREALEELANGGD